MTYEELMDQVNRRAEARRASDREMARLAGMTIEKFDADTTVYDFDVDGNLVVAGETLDGNTAWKMFVKWNEGRCPVCGCSAINKHELVCDDCLEKAVQYRTSGPPVDWRQETQ